MSRHALLGLYTIISQLVFIKHAAPSLMSDICYPNTAYAESIVLASLQQLVPQWLIQFFWKAISMRSNDGDISWFWVAVIEWRVLLDGYLQHIFLVGGS